VKRLVFVAAAVLLLSAASCGGDDDGTPTPRPTEQPTAQFTFTPTPEPTATSPAPTGAEIALDVPEAGGTVALAAGNYRTSRFQPEARFALGEGWSAAFDTARFLQLYRGGDPAANCICLINPDAVIDPAGGDEKPLPGGGPVDGLIEWLTSNPKLKTSNPSSLQVGNLPGRQLDVQLASGSATVDYLSAGEQTFSVRAGERQHLIVLNFREAPLIIAQRSPAAEYNDYLGFVEGFVGSLSLAN
jgi:hypothetical protein